MRRETDLPEPPGVKPVKGLQLWRPVVGLALIIGLGIAAFRVPIPIFYAYLPGPIRDVQGLVEVQGADTYSSEGALYLTTVSVDVEVTFVDWISALIDPHTMIVMKEDVTGGLPLDEVELQQRIQMEASKEHAEEVALGALGLAAPTGDGVRVQATEPGSPAEGVFREGDTIIEVDGVRTLTTCQAGAEIDRHRPGERIFFTIKRKRERRTVSVEAAARPEDASAPFIGILMRDLNFQFDPGFEIEFKTGRIAGPSAGLMFTLALYDRLTPDDLTGGRAIAGTGEIACDGGVGSIGGIEQKVAAAEAEGAEIFLAPAGNYDAAVDAADAIEVVSVSNFREALEHLEGLD
ncbi:MAG: YlbL family protein [Actinomycetota bacterium]